VQNKNQNFHSLIYPNPEPIETRMKMGGGGDFGTVHACVPRGVWTEEEGMSGGHGVWCGR
jgi:hypothetical protein